MATETDTTSASTLETRGIEPVPPEERHGRPGQLFWVSLAANISIHGLPLGATLVATGMTVWQAVVVGYLFTTAGPADDAWFTGPPAGTWLGENGLAWVITFLVGAGTYAALGGARERRA
jgi:hypothetical protein